MRMIVVGKQRLSFGTSTPRDANAFVKSNNFRLKSSVEIQISEQVLQFRLIFYSWRLNRLRLKSFDSNAGLRWSLQNWPNGVHSAHLKSKRSRWVTQVKQKMEFHEIKRLLSEENAQNFGTKIILSSMLWIQNGIRMTRIEFWQHPKFGFRTSSNVDVFNFLEEIPPQNSSKPSDGLQQRDWLAPIEVASSCFDLKLLSDSFLNRTFANRIRARWFSSWHCYSYRLTVHMVY